MPNLNMPEIVFLAVLAVVIFGPEKLPELARKAARVLKYLRNIANDAQGRLRDELGPEFADLELTNPKAMVTKHLLDPVQAELEPLRAEFEPLKTEIEPLKAGIEPVREAVESGASAGMREPASVLGVAFDNEAT